MARCDLTPPRRTSDRSGAGAASFQSSEVPPYFPLASVLKEQILSGRYSKDDQWPTGAELGAACGTGRISVRQAPTMPERDGLVRRQVGRGTFATEALQFSGERKVEGSLDDLISLGHFTSVNVVEVRTVKANRADALPQRHLPVLGAPAPRPPAAELELEAQQQELTRRPAGA